MSLTFNYQPGSDPSTISDPTSAGFHHPSIYGAYLNALVLFQKIAGRNVSTTFNGTEKAAAAFHILPDNAVQLQKIAAESVSQQNNAPTASSLDPCKN